MRRELRSACHALTGGRPHESEALVRGGERVYGAVGSTRLLPPGVHVGALRARRGQTTAAAVLKVPFQLWNRYGVACMHGKMYSVN